MKDSSPTVTVVDKGFRYVRTPIQGGGYNEELFDIEHDPAELADVGEGQREIVEGMRALADSYLEGEPPWKDGAPSLELDEMQLNQLRALGYKVP